MCKRLYEIYGDDFKMILTVPMTEAKKALGFKDNSIGVPYVIRTWEEDEDYIYSLCNDAEILLCGAAPFKYIENRVKNNKLTFKFTERLFKKGLKSLFKPKNLSFIYNTYTKFKNKNKYFVLGAGYYTPRDFNLIGIKKEQILTWGYFPTIKDFEERDLLSKKPKDKLRVVWVGRFVSLKHPEVAIYACKYLKDNNIDFDFNFIGRGDLESKIKELIDKYNLQDNVHILGSMPPEEVRNHMESSNVFMFNSNYSEGWGASLSEAMGSGCCPIVSSAIGGAKVLIENGKTGYIYEYNNQDQLNELLCHAAKDLNETNNIGLNAYKLMHDLWNGEVGINRLCSFSEAVLDNNTCEFETGPVSYSFKGVK